MTDKEIDIRAFVEGTDIVVRIRPTGAINISTNVQHDRDNLEVRTFEEWCAIVSLVAELRQAQAAAKIG